MYQPAPVRVVGTCYSDCHYNRCSHSLIERLLGTGGHHLNNHHHHHHPHHMPPVAVVQQYPYQPYPMGQVPPPVQHVPMGQPMPVPSAPVMYPQPLPVPSAPPMSPPPYGYGRR